MIRGVITFEDRGDHLCEKPIPAGDSDDPPSKGDHRMEGDHLRETERLVTAESPPYGWLLNPDDQEVIFDIAQAALLFGCSEDELAEQIERARRLA